MTAFINTKSVTPLRASVTLILNRVKVRGNVETDMTALPEVSDVFTVAAVDHADHVV